MSSTRRFRTWSRLFRPSDKHLSWAHMRSGFQLPVFVAKLDDRVYIRFSNAVRQPVSNGPWVHDWEGRLMHDGKRAYHAPFWHQTDKRERLLVLYGRVPTRGRPLGKKNVKPRAGSAAARLADLEYRVLIMEFEHDALLKANPKIKDHLEYGK